MKANKLWMLKDFLNTNKVLFKIPVYQRNYDWSESNCNRLLLDIKNVIETNNKHFIGAVVYMSDDTNSVPKNVLIIMTDIYKYHIILTQFLQLDIIIKRW